MSRNIRQNMLEALDESPAVLINGARQTGKSTLVRTLKQDFRYFTFDDPAVLAAAQTDPAGFIGALEAPVCLDEVQRAPGIFLAIKAEVDKDRTPGRFLLTGSANALLLPQIADSLAGRMDALTLWPLAQSEIADRPLSIIDRLFDGDFPDRCAYQRDDFIDRLCATRRLSSSSEELCSTPGSKWFVSTTN
ncbi:putative AAA+ superfamily ATPase [Pseudomonas sp. TE3786]